MLLSPSCRWKFNVAENTKAVLSCGSFHVENHDSCNYDSLSLIYGGAVRGLLGFQRRYGVKWCSEVCFSLQENTAMRS